MASEINLIPLIKELGNNLVCCEVGVLRASNLIPLVDRCPNIAKIYGIDFYKAYIDNLYYPNSYKVTQELADHNKKIALDKIKNCNRPEIITLIEKDANDAVKDFEDSSLDFVYTDRSLDYDTAYEDVINWYPKVKSGKVIAGHDWYSKTVRTAVIDALRNLGQTGKLKIINEESWWYVKP